jgi:hypothetical protein
LGASLQQLWPKAELLFPREHRHGPAEIVSGAHCGSSKLIDEVRELEHLREEAIIAALSPRRLRSPDLEEKQPWGMGTKSAEIILRAASGCIGI